MRAEKGTKYMRKVTSWSENAFLKECAKELQKEIGEKDALKRR